MSQLSLQGKPFEFRRARCVAAFGVLGLLGLAPMLQASAQAPTAPAPSFPPSAERTGNQVFIANAPDRYTVVKGDTLWDLAGRFLTTPWRWPEIWQMNRDQIRNPHWIYPGQVIVLDKSSGTMRLSGASGETVNLSPRVRETNEREAIASIPLDAIEPFLTQPMIVENATMRDAPRIVAGKERVLLSSGDTAYVSGISDRTVTSYQVFRPGKPLLDPDTGKVIAYQADYLGTADITRQGDPATAILTSFHQEIGAGDRLVPTVRVGLINYVPHQPDRPIAGRIVASYDGVTFAGKNMVVALNRGRADGLEVGHVLASQVLGATITDRTNGGSNRVKLPDERNGLMFVFRVFDKISYALITSSTEPVKVGDVFTQP